MGDALDVPFFQPQMHVKYLRESETSVLERQLHQVCVRHRAEKPDDIFVVDEIEDSFFRESRSRSAAFHHEQAMSTSLSAHVPPFPVLCKCAQGDHWPDLAR